MTRKRFATATQRIRTTFMHRWKIILFNLAFALNCLLVFLLVFEQQLKLPSWLQVAGRMHPLILHFPIVLLVLAVFWELLPQRLIREQKTKIDVGDVLLLAASVSAVFTSLFGLFLSREKGYEPDVLLWHKWGGVIISLLTLGWYSFRSKVRQVKSLLAATTVVGLLLIVITGHKGADITHGENFLLAPLHSDEKEPAVLLEDAVVYSHMVRPILEAKCMGCHNQKKAKGELAMENEALLLKGGKDGVLWDTSAKDFGLLFQRLHLPLDNKKHMPPRGKPQLTDEEIEILYRWVKNGADWKKKVLDLPETDSLRLLAADRFQTVETDDYAFPPANDNELKKLNTSYRVIAPLAAGSPALGVEYFSAANYNSAAVKDLLPIKEQIVSLNLNKMPVGDEDLKVIGQLKNLRKLNLAFTNISGATLTELKGLEQLRQLSLAGTKVKWSQVQPLVSLPKLSRLYLWNTGISEAELKQATARFKHLSFESGYKGDTVVLKLNPPQIENEEQILFETAPLKLKHVVKGTTIRFTTDGTVPDSVHSPVFRGSETIGKNVVVKAKAFKTGWISSDVVERTFYKAGVRPDSVQLVNAPNPQYKGEGAATLMDARKGDQNFRSGKWIGFQDKPLAAILYLNHPVPLSSVTISALIDIGSSIMPPRLIEVWGGEDSLHLHLLKRFVPQQPVAEKPGSLQAFTVSFPPAMLEVVKVVVTPVEKLPAWHRSKGQRGWVFSDEIFLNE
ncbi:DUF2231 domain-containing protein [Flavisolibacter nicotianae]|uniref:DUF2231 domain-containing protein n=1 Tax=Flavisolibacter nicotianae TaxID=2364882 RepID=UPI000EB433C2|nr:DUF2231 domain-containing protein [Flavisolibacter nicotianae]